MHGPRTSIGKSGEKDIVRWCARRFELPVAIQSRYDATTYQLLLLVAAVRNLFLESALNSCRYLRGMEVPSPRSFLYRLRTWSEGGRLEGALMRLNHQVLVEARRRRALPNRAVVAIDETDTRYYGKKGRLACRRGKEKRGTTWFHRAATVSLIVRGSRYTVAWVKVLPLMSTKDVVAALLDAAEEWVDVKLVLMDRGFYSWPVRRLLRERGVRLLMAAPKYAREKMVVARCKGLNWLAEPFFEGRGHVWTLIVVDNRWLREQLADRRVEKGYSLWLTDLPFRGNPLPYVRVYNRRWSIENSYQEEDRFEARTKSPVASLRFCIILVGVVLRNLWVLLRTWNPWLTTFLLREIIHDMANELIGERSFDPRVRDIWGEDG